MAAVAPVRDGFCVADVNADGPLHAYVAPDTVGAVKLIALPEHTGELLVAAGVAGNEFTTTVVVPARLVHPPTVTVKLYVPAIAAVAPVRVGFWVADVYPDGPVQAYVAPVTVGVVKVIAEPAHTGELLVGAGVDGNAFTATVVVAARLVHPLTVTVKLYVPAMAAVADGRAGSSTAAVYDDGPVQL